MSDERRPLERSKANDTKQASRAGGEQSTAPKSLRVRSAPKLSTGDQNQTKARTTKSGGKDRHSKVNTARGPRDRRVRLSVSTAIQFYDIQDRLGFDQPSKAIEWLLKKAKPAIDELNQRPPPPLSIGRSNALEDSQSTSQAGFASPTSAAGGGAAAGSAAAASGDSYPSYRFQQEQEEQRVWKHESDELEQQFQRVAKSTERAERVREQRMVKPGTPIALPDSSHHHREDHHHHHHHHQQEDLIAPFTSFLPPPHHSAGFFDSFAPPPPPAMRSSFTQLLQSPLPTALQSLIQSSSQGQFFSALHFPTTITGLSTFHHHGSSFQQEIADASAHPGAPGSLHSFHHHNFVPTGGHSHHWTSNAASCSVLSPPYARASSSSSHQQAAAGGGGGGGFSTLDIFPRIQKEEENEDYLAKSSSSLYVVPARIQGIDDDHDDVDNVDPQRRQPES